MDFDNLWLNYNPKTYEQNNRCLSVNTILAGKYLVGPVLGQGGFGITYQGYDLNMETKIAIKEYFPVELVSRDTTTVHGDHVLSLSGEKSITYKQGLKKYVEEAQKVSQFSEIAGVVSVKDFFYENETAYIVMEYIEGESLKDYLKRKGGRLSEEETLFIMKPVIEALIKIHQAGIIHRDISPDNIMLTFDASKDNSVPEKVKSIKLIDFGAARMTAKNDQKSLTIILKHGYAPEEQYRTHGEQGPWTDVYAICATIYRMITGETPVPAMDRMFQDSLKSLDLFGIKISKNTQNALLKGLAVKKDDRIQSIDELLEVLYEGKTVSLSKKTGRTDKKTGFVIGAVILLLICMLSVLYLFINPFSGGSDTKDAITENMSKDLEIENDNAQISREEEISEVIVAEEVVEMEMKVDEELVGEQIAYPDAQTAISRSESGYFLLIRMPDGTVKAKGSNEYGQCNVEQWHNVVAVSAGAAHSVGLRSDGKVYAAGLDNHGQCGVDSWSDIVQISAGFWASFGLTKQGTVLVSGQMDEGDLHKVIEWKDIVAIAAEDYTDIHGIFAVDKYGNIHYEGNGGYPDISGWEGVTHLEYNNCELYGLKEDGTVLWVPLYENWIDHGVENWENIEQISGTNPVIGVNANGNVVLEEMVLYRDQFDLLKAEVSSWKDMEAVTMLSDYYSGGYVIGLAKDGTIQECILSDNNTQLEDMKNLFWIQFGDYYSGRLIAGTKDNRLLVYGGDRDFISWLKKLNEQNEINISQIKRIVDDQIVQLEDGRFFDYQDNRYVYDSAKQVLPWCGGYMVLTKDGRIQIPEGDGSDYSNFCTEQLSKVEDWTEVTQIAGADIDLYALLSDGTVISSEEEMQLAVPNMKSIVFNRTGMKLVGITKEGTGKVIVCGDEAERFNYGQIEQWQDLQTIAMGDSHIVGLKNDGTVVAIGSNHEGQCDVEDWSDIVYIEADLNCTLGITKDGELKIAGSLYY